MIPVAGMHLYRTGDMITDVVYMGQVNAQLCANAGFTQLSVYNFFQCRYVYIPDVVITITPVVLAPDCACWDHKIVLHYSTHWGQGKMAAIFQMTFSKAFSWMKVYKFWWRFRQVCSQRSNKQYSSIGSDNGLVLARRQAIIWTYDG